jgi:hypothetical protein
MPIPLLLLLLLPLHVLLACVPFQVFLTTCVGYAFEIYAYLCK